MLTGDKFIINKIRCGWKEGRKTIVASDSYIRFDLAFHQTNFLLIIRSFFLISCDSLFQSLEVTTWDVGQLLVGAVLCDLTLVHHHDAVTLLDRRHAVRDHHTSAAFHCPIERLLYNLLALLIQSTRCFIENHDLRRLNQRSSNRDPLLLSARELAAFKTAKLHEAWIELVFNRFKHAGIHTASKACLILTFDRLSSCLQVVTEVAQWIVLVLDCAEGALVRLHGCKVKLALLSVQTVLHARKILFWQIALA